MQLDDHRLITVSTFLLQFAQSGLVQRAVNVIAIHCCFLLPRPAVTRIEHTAQPTQRHQYAAVPDPAYERFVVQTHRPAAIIQFFTQRGVKIAGKPAADGRFSHHHPAGGVKAFFGIQHGFRATIAADGNHALTAAPVRPDDITHALEDEVITMNIEAVASPHADIALDAIVLAEGDANDGYRHADMAEHHTPLATR